VTVTETPIAADQRNLIWVLRREVQMHGAPPVPARSERAARHMERKRERRDEALRGEVR
jgi:hypothetical protein